MSAEHHIRNPFELALEQLTSGASDAGSSLAHRPSRALQAPAVVRQVDAADLWDALRGGFRDFAAARDDVVFIGVIYPLAGLILAQAILNQDMLPLIFPLASGFALLGPIAALGLYEISRRREQGETIGWSAAIGVFRSPALGSIFGLGALLVGLFLVWLAAAYTLYAYTLGPQPPASVGGFLHDVFLTGAGWAMILVGCGVGALFAALVLAISVVAFPLMLDRGTVLGQAVSTSVRAVKANPRAMALWGLIVAGGLVLGSIPALVGLIVAVPVLGHATWRLYRKLIV